MISNRGEDNQNNRRGNDNFNILSQNKPTKLNAIQVPEINFLRGGGAIKGIDEKFSVNTVKGTESFSIPLPFSPACGASPALSLLYNSGTGYGIFGLGWNLCLPSIKRKRDKGLHKYIDGSFSVDTNGEYVINEIDSPDGLNIIRFYKPSIECLFARIEGRA